MDSKLRSTLANFATRFCNELDHEQNSVCSPISCELLLALTALGSTGDTRAELLKSLDLPDDEAVRSSFALISSKLKSVKGVTLRLANKVYVTKNGTLKPSIKKDAEDVFDSGLEQLDFVEKAAAAAIINKWVSEQTNNKIQDIISPDSFTDDTALVLVNAIYFQGNWETPFEEYRTEARTFHVNNTKSIQVPMMSMEDAHFKYKHSRDLKAKLLQMPYEGRQSSMVFVVPDEIEGLEEMMGKLATGFDLMTEVASMTQTKIDVMVPKFKIETEIDLKELLPKMGIDTIFDVKRSGIRMLTTNERQFVGQAVQKAIIEVNELGTEAAACSFLRMQLLCARRNERFTADRPFLYLVESEQMALFLGIYNDMRLVDLCDFDDDNPRFKVDRPFLYLLMVRRVSLILGTYRGNPASNVSESDVVAEVAK